MPAAIVDRLNREVVRTVNQPDIRQKLLNAGVEIVGGAPKELTASIAYQMKALGKIVKDSGAGE